MTLSIIIPAYNAEFFIEKTLDQLIDRFHNAEIIVVNDGSEDNTLLKIEKYLPKIKIINYPVNYGKGYALRQGFQEATGDIIIFTDADLPYSIDNISKIKDLLEVDHNCDLVVAIRPCFKESFIRKITHEACIWGTQFLFWLDIKDTQCGLKGFKKSFIKKIAPCLISNNFTIDIEILFLSKFLKLNLKTMPVIYEKAGSTTIKLIDLFKMLCELIKIRKNNYKKCLTKNS